MPKKHGPNTYKGFESPNTEGWPPEIRKEVRHVYGSWRQKHPGESHRTKSLGASIAWSTARKKYPDLYRRHQKIQRQIRACARKERKEHSWMSKEQSEQTATDHIMRNPGECSPHRRISKAHRIGNSDIQKARRSLNPIYIKPAHTVPGRKKQVRDLRAAARQERKWSKIAENEGKMEQARISNLKKSGFKTLAADTAQDVKLAKDFSRYRKKKADDYDLQAARIQAISGD